MRFSRKTKLVSIWAVLVIAIFKISAGAQMVPATAEDLNARMARAEKIVKGIPWRDRMTVEFSDTADGPWQFYSEQYTEHIGADRSRNVQLSGLRLETIWIGDTVYSRRPNSDWEVRTRTTNSTQTVWKLEEPKVEYRESMPVKKSEVMTETIRTGGSARLINGQVIDRSGTLRQWFDPEGRLVKVEQIGYNPDRKCFTRYTHIYEYDPNITITAPVIR